MASDKVNRRVFLRVITAVGSAAAAGLVAACNNKPKEFSCADVSSLKDEEKKVRESVKYSDKSPEPGKKCGNCLQFIKPPAEGQCGSCKVVKGPIHPEGYCTLWAKMA